MLSGVYNIKKPNGFNEVDTIVDRNDEFWGVDNFILGEETELSIYENYDPETFNNIKGVYDELGGDAQIVFRWFVIDKNSSETSLLEDNYQLNLNDIEFKSGLERNYIRFKIKKREEQNKFNTRKDTTVDLFSNTNLDNNTITPVQTDELYFKKIIDSLVNTWNAISDQYSTNFYNTLPGALNNFLIPRASVGDEKFVKSYLNIYDPLFVAQSSYNGVSLKILNLNVNIRQDPTQPTLTNNFRLVGYVNEISNSFFQIQSTVKDTGSYLITEIDIVNEDFDVPNLSISDRLYIVTISEDSRIPDTEFFISTSFQYQLKLNTPDFAVKTNSVRLFDAIDQVSRQYTDGETTLESTILSSNGRYHENYINSFIGLRASEKNNISQSLKTNFESIFENGVSKVMALGYDLRSDKLKIEDINYFFKDVESFDFSQRDYERSTFMLNQYDDLHFNTLLTGYKKFSSQQDEDLFNFNTNVELTSPIKSLKNKLDVESEIVTDEYIINESVNDLSNSTNDKDDDVILLDSVLLQSYTDSAYYNSVIHKDNSGDLILEQYDRSFLIDFEIGQNIEISTGLNTGFYTVDSLTSFDMNLGNVTGIQTGTSANIITINRGNILKNRTNEGFDVLNGVSNISTASNVIHNPIYQLFRWYPLWGSGLTKKELNTEIIVNDYKNNGDVTVKVNSGVFPKEYPNEITLDQNFSQIGFQGAGLLPLFTGDQIEIKIYNVDFFEFFEIFNNWRYGNESNDSLSFGYVTIPTPYGVKKIYPFGEEAFNHKRSENALTIKGLVKYGS
ncbi:hypothetical protein [uncultured Mediterranean phage uvMED]|nr:hypothetical protein [uncultured Mediterranean phage uvMED]